MSSFVRSKLPSSNALRSQIPIAARYRLSPPVQTPASGESQATTEDDLDTENTRGRMIFARDQSGPTAKKRLVTAPLAGAGIVQPLVGACQFDRLLGRFIVSSS